LVRVLDKFKDMEPLKVKDLVVISHFVGHFVGQLVVLRVCTYGMGEQQCRAWVRSLSRRTTLD